jgi:acyl-CoA synthetase
MSARSESPVDRWKTRQVPDELARRYETEGWWTDQTIGDLIADGLGAMGDATFRVHSDARPWHGTIGDVDQAARAFAGWLQTRGIGSGSVVVSQLPNWVEAAITFWGAAYAGAVVVPVVHFYGAKELGHIVRVTEPSLVVTPDRFGRTDYRESYSGLLGDLGWRWAVVGDTAGKPTTGATPYEHVLAAEPIKHPVPVDPNGPALVAFTSGTTRDPKGVIHSHRTLGFEARQLTAMTPNGGPPPITGAPVGHFIGMLNALVCSLVRRQAINLIDVWNPGRVLELMLRDGLTVAGGSTYFLTSLLDHPDFAEEHLKYMPHFGMGGSPVPLAVAERATKLGIKVFRSYGSTEQPSITGCHVDGPEVKRLATDGRPLPGAELRLDEDGQIHCRGPELFLGYTDPDLTASSFDGDGWYHTGDVGVLDDDGYLTITDRISDLIIRGGENISAQEVEELLLGIDSIAEVAVVAEPDMRLGERAVAVIRARAEMSAPTLAEVRAHLAASGLAKQKWPETIREVSDFPRTPSGKVQKFRLRQQLREGHLNDDLAAQ